MEFDDARIPTSEEIIMIIERNRALLAVGDVYSMRYRKVVFIHIARS